MRRFLLAGIAECAWAYILASGLVDLTTGGAVLSFWAIVAPYALGATVMWGLGRASLHAARGLLIILRNLLVTSAFLAAWVGCVLGVIWHSYYQDGPLLSLSWVSQIPTDVQGGGAISPVMIWSIVLSTLAWWRGSQMARGAATFQRLLPLFACATAALVAALMAGLPIPLPSDTVCWLLAAYLLFGLAAMAETRSHLSRTGRIVAGERRRGSRGRLMALLLLAAGFGLAILLLPLLQQAGQLVHDWLVNDLIPTLLAIWNTIMGLFGRTEGSMSIEPMPAPSQMAQDKGSIDLPEIVRNTGRAMFNIGWIGSILVAIYIWVSRWFKEHLGGDDAGPERERIAWHIDLRPRAILRWILRWLASRWPSLLRWSRWAATSEEPSWGIRELYRKLLIWGIRRGYPRELGATPREYAFTLSERWPVLSPDFELLTESYLRARYGQQQVGGADFGEAISGWQRISSHREPKKKRPWKKRGAE